MYSMERIDVLLGQLYGDGDKALDARKRVFEVLEHKELELAACNALRGKTGPARLSERDAFLITYGNTFAGEIGEVPLAAFRRFALERLSGIVSYIHILPFFPYSSDDGFSIMDYRTVNPDLGGWADVEALGQNFKLAFDLVINHVSSQSAWFQAFLRGDPEYSGWFITRPDGYDTSRVTRPRTHPLLTSYSRTDGERVNAWTTFSADQVDFDFSNPAVLAEMLDIFLEYVARGARIIRMDAIAYLWKEDGHSCLHHPKTHVVVRLFRAVVDALGLDVLLLTETNVPHEENLSYFGSGDEAHMVYNFALPPLTLHAFISGDAECLSVWVRNLKTPIGGVFLNFLASHDGIGLNPARGLVDEEAFRKTLATAVKRKCLLSYKTTPSGPEPYELNASWFDAVSDPALPEELRIRAHLASHALAASLDGMPAIYIHSVLGTENWIEGPKIKGYNRAINRRALSLADVEAELSDPQSHASRTFAGIKALYANRSHEPALSPGTPTRVLSSQGAVFALLRGEIGKRLLCAVNVSSTPASFTVPPELKPADGPYDPTVCADRLQKGVSGSDTLSLAPYGVLWRAYV
jgi:glucosylglycerate phosphorylase